MAIPHNLKLCKDSSQALALETLSMFQISNISEVDLDDVDKKYDHEEATWQIGPMCILTFPDVAGMGCL